MTITEERPTTGSVSATGEVPAAEARRETWFDTADHKRIGQLYLVSALAFGVVAAGLAAATRAAGADLGFDAGPLTAARLGDLSGTAFALLFLAPAWVGLATYVVPLQIGAARLAFPRLHALTFWAYLAGAGVVVAAYAAGDVRGGLLRRAAVAAPPGGSNLSTQLWVTGLVVVALASLVAALDLVVTVVTQRARGLTFPRVAPFTWAAFGTSVGVLLATPVFVAGLVLAYLEHRFGGSVVDGNAVTFFAADQDVAAKVWQHAMWLLGRPEVFLLALPALGVVCEVVAVAARRPLLGPKVVGGLLVAFAFLSFAAWAQGARATRALVLPTATVPTTLVAAPVGLLVLVWLATLARGRKLGRPQAGLALAFAVSALLLWGGAAVNAAVAALVGVDAGTDSLAGSPLGAWSSAQVHVVAFYAPALALGAALFHWGPKIWGRHPSAALGGLGFLALYFGALADVGPLALLGYGNGAEVALARVATVGAALAALGLLALLLAALAAARGRGREAGADPWSGHTLEWATASPPPRHNFDDVPEVTSASPLFDRRTASAPAPAANAVAALPRGRGGRR